MASGDIYKAAFNTRVNGVNCAMVMYFEQMDDEASEFAPDSLKAALQGQLLPTWVPMLSNDAEVTSVAIKKILPSTEQPAVYPFTGGTGTVAQEAEPPNLAVVFSHYTDDNQRKGRGRNYLAGVAQTLIQGAIPKATFVSLFATFKAKLLSAMIQGGSAIHWTMTHYSAFDDAANRIIHIEQRMQLRVLRSRITN